MKNLILIIIFSAAIVSQMSCSQKPKAENDSVVADADSGAAPAESDAPKDEFADFDAAAKSTDPVDQVNSADAGTPVEKDLEDEFKTADQAPAPALPPPQPVVQQPIQEIAPQPAIEIKPAKFKKVAIKSVQFKLAEKNGTLIIDATGPLNYNVSKGSGDNETIVSIPNASLPKKLARPLETKAMNGLFYFIKPERLKDGSSRFVIKMAKANSDPIIQAEGNSLLVMGSGFTDPAPIAAGAKTNTAVFDAPESPEILTTQALSDYLAGTTKFYGKKISIETTNNVEVRDALRLIADEAGVNMVISDEVKGSVSLKLRQVPWDQALVILMKTKKLGYTKQGNVLRIVSLEALKQEEDDILKSTKSRQALEPLKVRLYSISYGKIDELEKKVRDFLTDRGKVVGDSRTSSIVVTDIEENLIRVGKLIENLDTAPQQVMIEGKIVEASERFSSSIGVHWDFRGTSRNISNGPFGPVALTPGADLTAGKQPTAFNFNMALGTLDILGDLSARLSLEESEDRVKVLSSPKIVTLSNETARISQTTEVPIKQVTQSGTSASVETFSYKPLELTMDVTPQITADSSIIMKLLVKREFAGALQSNGSFAINRRQADTRIVVRNGQTAVIAGIYQSDGTEQETGVPYLRKIPLLGALFRGKSTVREKSELMIFITPRILSQTNTSVKAETQMEKSKDSIE